MSDFIETHPLHLDPEPETLHFMPKDRHNRLSCIGDMDCWQNGQQVLILRPNNKRHTDLEVSFVNHQDLAELINSPDRITTLSTAGSDGTPNSAVIGSAFMADEDHIWIGLADNRTGANLAANPKAMLLACRPGSTVLDWKGGRLTLELTAMETQGERFDQMVERIRTTAGRFAARSIRQLAICRISEVRPLAELGKRQR